MRLWQCNQYAECGENHSLDSMLRLILNVIFKLELEFSVSCLTVTTSADRFILSLSSIPYSISNRITRFSGLCASFFHTYICSCLTLIPFTLISLVSLAITQSLFGLHIGNCLRRSHFKFSAVVHFLK